MFAKIESKIKISIESVYTSASWYQETNFEDMAIKILLTWPETPGNFVILFRAFDKQNYYRLSLWDQEESKNIILTQIKGSDEEVIVIATSQYNFRVGFAYALTIYYRDRRFYLSILEVIL